MKHVIFSIIALLSLSSLQAQIPEQTLFKETVYQYALKPFKKGGLGLQPKQAKEFAIRVFKNPIPKKYFTEYAIVLRYTTAPWEKKGLELKQEQALKLSNHITKQKNVPIYLKTIQIGVEFSSAKEKNGGLEYPKEQAIEFAKRFAGKKHGIQKMKAYKELYLFARTKLKMNKEQATKYAEDFISKH